MEKEAWRALIFYLTKKGNNADQTRKELESEFGDEAPSYSTVVKWAAEWRRGGRSVFDAKRSGRPSDTVTWENITRVSKLIDNDPRLTLQQICNITKISMGSVYTIMNRELELSKISTRWVPKNLTNQMKISRYEISHRNLERMREDKSKFFDRIVTHEETWVHHFDPETKEQAKELRKTGSTPSRKSKKAKRSGKVMASIFWDSKGILMIDYLQKGQTINSQYYADLLVRLREVIKEKRRGKLSKGVLLLQDNALVHTTSVAVVSATNCEFEILDHPAYSPDLAPSDFYLFPTLKREIGGRIFESDDEVIDAVEEFFENKNEAYFTTGIQKLEDRWLKCVEKNGDYFET